MLLIHTMLYKFGCYLRIFTSAVQQLTALVLFEWHNIFHCGMVPVDRCCLPDNATVNNK